MSRRGDELSADVGVAIEPLRPLDYQRDARLARADQNAAAAYLARLDHRSSRPSQESSLRRVSWRLLWGSWEEPADAPREPWLLVPWGSMRYLHVRGIFSELKARDAAPATLKRYVVALRAVAAEARRMRQMPAEDYQDIVEDDTFKYGERLPPGRMLSAEEVEALFRACTPDIVGWRNGALLALLVTGGVRRDEAARAKVQNFDPDGRTLRIVGKFSAERDVVLPTGASRAIQHWLTRRGVKSPWIFPRMRLDRTFDPKEPMTGQGVWHALKKLVEAAGGGGLTPHDFRRTFISGLLDDGVDIATVSKLAGHKNTNTTARYDRRGLKTRKDVVEKHLGVKLSEEWWK